MDPPLLPWEVLERIIGHSGNHSRTLHNFSLTCHNLRPRALCLLVADVHFKTRVDIFRFCDFLHDKSHLKPLVRSVTMSPDDFAPFPLLSILPNVSKVRFACIQPEWPRTSRVVMVMNQSSLTCCERFGTNIQALHFSDLSFPTYLDFARVLLTFSCLTDLKCSRTVIGSEGNQAPLDVLKRRLSHRLRLRTISLHYYSNREVDTTYISPVHTVAALLLDSGLVQSTTESLNLQPYRGYQLSHLFEWPRLRSLVLRLYNALDVCNAVTNLDGFSPSTLKDVVVELRRQSIRDINRISRGETNSRRLLELEEALLRFSRPRLRCLVDHLHKGGASFWTEKLGKYFPVLSQRKAFSVTSRTVLLGAGQDYSSDLTISPDGKWVATASFDSTVMLWDAAEGTTVHQWIAHDYTRVKSLAFCPDGPFLASGGDDSKVKIWDLAESPREVTTLEGHTRQVTCCAWSPRGDLIASGSFDGTIRVWDARTFRELHVLEKPGDGPDYINLTVFSPDGRWLVYGSILSNHVWNVDSSMAHRSFRACGAHKHLTIFDSSSTRLLVPEGNAVKLVDVESGEGLAVWSDLKSRGTDAAFSLDGTLLLIAFDNGIVKLWDANTSAELFSLEGHEKSIRGASFSPCGQYVASASGDGTVRLWRTGDGSCVATFSEHQGTVVLLGATFSSDGETLWSRDSDGTIIMRRMRDIFPADGLAL